VYFTLILTIVVVAAALCLLMQYRTHALDAPGIDEPEVFEDPAAHEPAKAA
jgi:hypothetical protein